MRPIAALLAPALLAACAGGGTQPSMAGLAGEGNVAALDAAVRCEQTQALALARAEGRDAPPPRRVFSRVAEAAVLRDTGEADAAEAVLDTLAADPELNPQGRSRAEFSQAADALLSEIRRNREAALGSASC